MKRKNLLSHPFRAKRGGRKKGEGSMLSPLRSVADLIEGGKKGEVGARRGAQKKKPSEFFYHYVLPI